MRIAALSDIHSNVFALEAVIKDIKQRGADVVVNLGDITFICVMEHPVTT